MDNNDYNNDYSNNSYNNNYTPADVDMSGEQPEAGKATGALVCSIIGLFICGIPLGITSIILAIMAKNAGNTSTKCTVALVLGIIDIVGMIIVNIFLMPQLTQMFS
ncbi:MAG: hypothetical protein J5685_02025 [Clostridiales bacterium]|nr:hypothetical protein [Clostridiales bacterium]